MMQLAVLLAVAASFCTATASIAQRQGARSVQTTGGFDVRLIFRLARRPVWLLGIASMIGGFVFQVTALRYGALALVQPILALELLLVFGYMAIAGRRQVRVKKRDLLAAAAMSAGIGLFLGLASPSGGRLHAPGSSWLLAGLLTFGVVLAALAVAFGPGNRPGAPPSRRAALLGAATGIAWGFVAAVIKELSSHLGDGPGAIFSTWSLYVLLVAGAATMLLASHALAAGPLAASQPGFTVLDPLSAGLLGVFLFGEHIRTGPWDLASEALALALVITGAVALSHSCFILGELGDPSCLPAELTAQARRGQVRKLSTLRNGVEVDSTFEVGKAGSSPQSLPRKGGIRRAARKDQPVLRDDSGDELRRGDIEGVIEGTRARGRHRDAEDMGDLVLRPALQRNLFPALRRTVDGRLRDRDHERDASLARRER
jgi:drug/metabolite transporter (DMT)-like permease